ncbi:hypothetical protein Salat_0202500 [Sesamum alatum]|uniref:DUF4283 domain-containing protein n=1 Tax=Sesamum alatum TaxID=300844 RepID=A0AAE2CY44_9LAMI|nr:hypothetical protein Salat_0202500 [Sesamum alatum]
MTKSGNMDDTGLYLVRHLLDRRPAKFNFLKETLVVVMNPVKGMDIRCIADNTFLFIFRHELDKNRALEGCPWNFEKNILILNEVGKDENPLSVDLSWCSFFVHIHDLPIRKITREVAKTIGNRMGHFIDMEDHRHWCLTLRIRVQINVFKPLMRCMKIQSSGERFLGPRRGDYIRTLVEGISGKQTSVSDE